MTRLLRLWGEAIRVATAQPVTTAATAVIVAAVCGVIVSTTGQTVAIERDVLGRIDDAGTRTLIIEDAQGRADLDARTVERINAIDGVDWALGFGGARDYRAAGLPNGPAVPMRRLVGDLPSQVTSAAWNQEPGTALAGLEALSVLGFEVPAGPVEAVGAPAALGVVGWLRAVPPLEFLNGSLLAVAPPDEPVVRIVVMATSPERVAPLHRAIGAVLDADDPSSIVIRTSDALVQVRTAVRGELGIWGRNVVTLVLAAGLALTAINVFGAVTMRRRDFGRRRALGASRFDIIVLVTAQTVTTALIGAVLGVCAGSAIVVVLLGTAPAVDFGIAVAVLAVLATTLAAVPPAVVAAYRDPVSILRVP